MKSLVQVVKENVTNLHLIGRLSMFELKSNNNNNYLGMLWEIITPMILISIYWFVFGFGIRGGKPVGGIEYLPWMLSGISVWFFISHSLPLGSKSIYTRINIISKMNFPMSVIPTYVITSKFYHHVTLVGIIAVILLYYGYTPSIYSFQLPYFMLANLVLLVAISLITSTLATIVRDVQMVIQSVVRVLLYLTPILWTVERLPEQIRNLMKANPFYYIIEGYRAALLGTEWYFVDHAKYTLYFWVVVLVLLWLGSSIHLKFKDRFVDYL
ncbi:ABC transporter permease [Neobacillus sp. NPDC058068]|uniref:ABC transporter permease n=1 Tax=Neobacillus sp. NPDC058068 TaxID=3346325 RepID=UPI0036DDEE77